MTILLYSLAPPDGQTNGMCQLGARPVPLPIHQQMTGRLVRPPTHCRVLVQQPPFLLDMGRIPCMGFEPRQNPSGLETVNKFMKRMKSATKEAKSAICKVQEDMTWYYN